MRKPWMSMTYLLIIKKISNKSFKGKKTNIQRISKYSFSLIWNFQGEYKNILL